MATGNAPIASVEGAGTANVQRLFEEAIARWQEAGLRVAGLVEETHGLPGRVCSAGILRGIGSGRPYSIYLEIPPAGKTCHVDANGAETAGTSVLDEIAACDLVVLSKFGKLEAGNRGLIGAFEAAITAQKPVLTSVSEKHRAAWRAFAPEAVVLPPRIEAIEAWLANRR
ncbi:DUF2478 domain-containing protein [Hyphomicrobium sp.]|uniref:DUF2478 domain-containing protein n=1 Tax=Hyphomicrobium sp. TaxID=82 RepID=UPI002FE2E98A